MPLSPPFKRHYTPGDLVYGLSEVRELYSKKYDSFRHSETPRCIYTIDQYPATETERKWLSVKPDNLDDFLQILQLHPKYNSVYSGKGFALDGRAVESNPDDKRRKCKAGLYWGARRSGRFSIHFLLDDLDIAQVVSKTNEADKEGGFLVNKYRAYTGVELRWVYRNRNDQGVRKSIQFWYHGEPCGPPWEAGFDIICGKAVSHLWNDYQPRRIVQRRILAQKRGT